VKERVCVCIYVCVSVWWGGGGQCGEGGIQETHDTLQRSGELVRSTKMAQDGGGPPPIEVAGGSMEGGRIPSPQPSINNSRGRGSPTSWVGDDEITRVDDEAPAHQHRGERADTVETRGDRSVQHDGVPPSAPGDTGGAEEDDQKAIAVESSFQKFRARLREVCASCGGELCAS